jgi:ribulose-5-phosphate 4-epimerase/fuculose-1-phosphate aldolase
MTKLTNFISQDELALRIDLAVAFRLMVQFDWHESVGNHLSAAVSEDGSQFLLNPRWQHFSTITASKLQLLDIHDENILQSVDAPDATAWCIHGQIHAQVPEAKIILHCHTPYATALACLEDPTLYPIDQNTARFFNRIAYDHAFNGLADEITEGKRLAGILQNHSVMMMANHGVTVVGKTVAEAFETLYFLERACKTLILAYSTGKPLRILSDEIAEKTARGWQDYAAMGDSHFGYLKAEILKCDPTVAEYYRTE